MDWSKAKTILIISFVVVNLILGYVLFKSEAIEEPTIKEDFIENAVELLKRKDIELDTTIPKYIPSLHAMTVEFEKKSIDNLNKAFFNGTGKKVKEKDDFSQIVKDKETLTIEDGRYVIYTKEDGEDMLSFLDNKMAIQLAEKFLEQRGYSIDDMELSFIEKRGDTYYLEYTKLYEGVYVEETFTRFEIDKTGIKHFERFWLNAKELGENEVYISTAPKAILALLSMEEAYGKTIKDISLCYYFDIKKQEGIDNPKETKQGKTIPAWRIQLDDGTKIFIDYY